MLTSIISSSGKLDNSDVLPGQEDTPADDVSIRSITQPLLAPHLPPSHLHLLHVHQEQFRHHCLARRRLQPLTEEPAERPEEEDEDEEDEERGDAKSQLTTSSAHFPAYKTTSTSSTTGKGKRRGEGRGDGFGLCIPLLKANTSSIASITALCADCCYQAPHQHKQEDSWMGRHQKGDCNSPASQVPCSTITGTARRHLSPPSLNNNHHAVDRHPSGDSHLTITGCTSISCCYRLSPLLLENGQHQLSVHRTTAQRSPGVTSNRLEFAGTQGNSVANVTDDVVTGPSPYREAEEVELAVWSVTSSMKRDYLDLAPDRSLRSISPSGNHLEHTSLMPSSDDTAPFNSISDCRALTSNHHHVLDLDTLDDSDEGHGHQAAPPVRIIGGAGPTRDNTQLLGGQTHTSRATCRACQQIL